MTNLKGLALAGVIFALVPGLVATPVQAQSDPAYAAARSAGQIGERMDGYLDIVGAETPELRRLVNDINIKRRAVYAQRARENGVTLEEYALSTGCQLILMMAPGEIYQAPNGSWQTRTAALPRRDRRCPSA